MYNLKWQDMHGKVLCSNQYVWAWFGLLGIKPNRINHPMNHQSFMRVSNDEVGFTEGGDFGTSQCHKPSH